MTNESSTTEENNKSNFGLIRALVIVAATTCILLVIWALKASQLDPYIKASLQLVGSESNGKNLFRINCAGCHGIAAQGLVGPNLHQINKHKTNKQLISQVISGKTPPMPSFQMEPEAMADLLAYLNSLN